ncbi:MAG: hypothetical protein GF308_12305 [Candidatus Heimdallarchaeota archaeon]|nr:hypothetical protein [Candidatus Heimdallarchaeota archaeon]
MQEFGHDSIKKNPGIRMYDQQFILKNKFTKQKLTLLLRVSEKNIVKAAKFVEPSFSSHSLSKKFERSSWEEALTSISSVPLQTTYHHQTALVLAFERLLPELFTVPQRAKFLRTIILELERMEHHLLILENMARGFSFSLLLGKIKSLRKILCKIKQRMTQNSAANPFITFGGVAFSLKDRFISSVISVLPQLDRKITSIARIFKRNPLLTKHFEDVGFLPRDVAKELALVGPLARSSGITIDVRKSAPYGAYDQVSFSIPVSDSCDLLGELQVYIDELGESLTIISELLRNLPEGEPFVPVNNFEIKTTNTIVRLEAPAGELFVFCFSQNGSLNEQLRRYQITTPLQINSQGILARITGEILENIPAILLSFSNCWQFPR